jgi:hypothetical protein
MDVGIRLRRISNALNKQKVNSNKPSKGDLKIILNCNSKLN